MMIPSQANGNGRSLHCAVHRKIHLYCHVPHRTEPRDMGPGRHAARGGVGFPITVQFIH